MLVTHSFRTLAGMVLLATALPAALGKCDCTDSCVIGTATPGCAKVTAANFTIADIIESSPCYEVMSSINAQSYAVDNACDTFYPFGDGTFLQLRGVTMNDGSFYIEKYIVADLVGHTGHFSIQGIDNFSGCSTCTDRQTILAKVGDIFVIYVCNLFRGLQAPDPPNFVYGYSSNKRAAQDGGGCYAHATAAGRAQDGGRYEYAPAANRFPAKCVTCFNGARCVGADKVPPADRVSLPGDAERRF